MWFVNLFVKGYSHMRCQYWSVVHRGEILRKAINESGKSVTFVAKRLHLSRRSFYNYFSNDKVPLDFLLQVSNVIGAEYLNEVPEIRNAKIDSTPEYKKCVSEKEQLKLKVSEMATELLELHRENKALSKRLASYETHHSLNEPEPKYRKPK